MLSRHPYPCDYWTKIELGIGWGRGALTGPWTWVGKSRAAEGALEKLLYNIFASHIDQRGISCLS